MMQLTDPFCSEKYEQLLLMSSIKGGNFGQFIVWKIMSYPEMSKVKTFLRITVPLINFAVDETL